MNTLYEWEKTPKKNIPDNEEYYYDEVGCELRSRPIKKEKPDKRQYVAGKDFLRHVNIFGGPPRHPS